PAEPKTESGAKLALQDDGSVLVEGAPNTEPQTVRWRPGPQPVHALRIESSTHAAKPTSGALFFNEHQIVAIDRASQAGEVHGQFVRLDLPGDNSQFPRVPTDGNMKSINLAEIQVFHGGQNIALRKKARQSSTLEGQG